MENEVQNNPTQENVATQNTTTSAPAEKKGFSIASMVLGIVSLVCCCIWYISIPCSILAIVFSIVGKKKGGKGMATAGLVLGIIAIALYVLLVVLGVGAMAGLTSAIGDMSY